MKLSGLTGAISGERRADQRPKMLQVKIAISDDPDGVRS